MPKTIALKGDYVLKEREANAAITPGDLVEIMSTGKLRRHATLGGPAQKAFALEQDLIGRGIDDNYAVDESVRYGVFQQGAEVFAWLQINESCVIGDFLESDAAGKLAVASTPVEGSNVAIALEAITGGGGVAKRVKVEIV
ncbi:MAG: hypothetical protein ACRDHF_19600 [Tepidiformaceae bacterium]